MTAKVAQGAEVSIREETGYPFRDSIEFKLSASQAVQFPLYLRVPQWCAAAGVKVNGEAIDVKARPLSYIVLDRTWKDGDRVTLQLPMQIAVRRWPKNQDAASVSYGPLSFSLAIKERWEKYGDHEGEVAGVGGLSRVGVELRPGARRRKIRPVRSRSSGGRARCRWSPSRPIPSPLALKAKARKIPNWQTDRNQMVEKLAAQPGPIRGAAGRDPAHSAGGGPLANWHVPRDRRRSRRPTIGLPR